MPPARPPDRLRSPAAAIELDRGARGAWRRRSGSVDLLTRWLGQISRAQDPGRLALVGPRAALLGCEDELVGRPSPSTSAPTPLVAAVIGALDAARRRPLQSCPGYLSSQSIVSSLSAMSSRRSVLCAVVLRLGHRRRILESSVGRAHARSTIAGPPRPVFCHARTRIRPPQMTLAPAARDRRTRTSASARWRAPLREGRVGARAHVGVDPALPAGRAAGGGRRARRPPGAGGGRRRPRRARPGPRAARLPGAAPRPLLPVAGHRLRVPRRAAAAPGRPADRGAGRARRLRAARSSSPAPSRSPRRCPTRRCARRASRSTRGDEVDLGEVAELLVEAGYERIDQVEERGQFAVRGGILDVFRRTEDRAARLELFGDEIESMRWFSTFTQRSLGEAERVELAPAAELASEHRELAELALEDEGERPDLERAAAARELPRAARADPPEAAVVIAAAEEIRDRAPRPLGRRDHRDARRRRAPPLRRRRRAARRAGVAEDSSDRRGRGAEQGRRRPISPSGPSAPTSPLAAIGEAESRARAASFAPAIAWSSRSRIAARPSGPATASTGSTRRSWTTRGARPMARAACFAEAQALRGLRLARPEAGGDPLPPARAPPPGGGRRRPRAAAWRPSPTCGSATTWSTRTTGSPASPASRPRRSPASPATTSSSSYRGSDRVFAPTDQLAKITRYVGTGGEPPQLSALGRRAGRESRPGPAAPRASWRESCSTSTRSAALAGATRSRPTASGS